MSGRERAGRVAVGALLGAVFPNLLRAELGREPTRREVTQRCTAVA